MFSDEENRKSKQKICHQVPAYPHSYQNILILFCLSSKIFLFLLRIFILYFKCICLTFLTPSNFLFFHYWSIRKKKGKGCVQSVHKILNKLMWETVNKLIMSFEFSSFNPSELKLFFSCFSFYLGSSIISVGLGNLSSIFISPFLLSLVFFLRSLSRDSFIWPPLDVTILCLVFILYQNKHSGL